MKKIFIVFISVLSLLSCKKGFLDVNTTPNNPVAVPPSTILPNTTVAIAFATGNELNRAAGALVQHVAGTANQVAQYDVFLLDQFDNSWNFEIYNGAINNLQILIDQHSNTSPAYSGIAKIEMAYAFSLAADIWGDVPYSQAGQGLKFETPRFDKVEDIYQGNATLGIKSLFDLVKEGIADLSKTSILKPGPDDLVYKGNLNSWARFGNSLLLKFAILISNRNPALAKSTIESVLTGNQYINATTLDFEVPFSNAAGKRNPIFDFNNVQRTTDQMLSSRHLALSRSLNDTIRLGKFFTKPTGNFVAFNNGNTTGQPPLATRSKYNTYITGDTDTLGVNTGNVSTGGATPIRILTWYQVNFYLAEAALILGTPGDPNAYYQAGIRANMLKLGIHADSVTKYFTLNPTVVTLTGTTEEKRKQIITQKYLASVGYPIEVYNDYRRTGYPVLALPANPQGDNPNVIPTRLAYPPNELARNPNAPNPRPKTDVKLWWAL